MEINQESFIKIKEKAEKLYSTKKEIYCPYFKKNYFKFRWFSSFTIFKS